MTELTVPIKGQPYTISVGLVNKTDFTSFKSSPTLTSGDVKVSKDGGVLVNVTNIPVATGKLVSVSLTADEMNADSVVVLFSDQAGDEWCDNMMEIKPTTVRFGEILALLLRLPNTIWSYVKRTLTLVS